MNYYIPYVMLEFTINTLEVTHRVGEPLGDEVVGDAAGVVLDLEGRGEEAVLALVEAHHEDQVEGARTLVRRADAHQTL